MCRLRSVLLALVVWVVALPAFGQALRTDNTGTTESTQDVSTTLTGVQSGDLLVACTIERDGAVVNGISDDVNGAWTQIFSRAASAARVAMYYKVNSGAGNPTVTADFNSGTSPKIITAAAFSGMATSSVLDQSNNTSTASNTNHTHGSITPTTTVMVFACLGFSADSNGVTYDGTLTAIPSVTFPASWVNRGSVGYRLSQAASAYNPTNVTSNSVSSEGGQASFVQSGGGGGPTLPPTLGLLGVGR